MGKKKPSGTKSTPQAQAKPSLSGTNSFSALAEASEELLQEAESRQTAAASASTSTEPPNGGKKLHYPLVWVDLEMTGLDIDQHTIIEVACIITDGDLEHKIEGPATAIHQPDEVLDSMNEWCVEHHGKSGLTQRVRESKVSMREAEEQLLEFVKKHCPDQGMAQLAGNSVHVDRIFLLKFMPELTNWLSYRIVDVSTVKELAKRWYPNAARKAPKKVLAHTALSDIRESIQELQYYRKTIFLGGGKGK